MWVCKSQREKVLVQRLPQPLGLNMALPDAWPVLRIIASFVNIHFSDGAHNIRLCVCRFRTRFCIK